jgi:hypothetical protein
MSAQYDLFDKTVGTTYQYLIQVRGDKLYTGDGIDFNLGDFVHISGSTTSPQVEEQIIIDESVSYTLSLNNTIDTTLPVQVIWNGLILRKGITNDYVISGDQIIINPEHFLEKEDVFDIIYNIYR